MMLCLFPWCLDTNKDVLLTEDFPSFEVDLFVCVEEGEVVSVRVLAVFVVFAEVGWVEEEFVDVVAEFCRVSALGFGMGGWSVLYLLGDVRS